MALRKNRLEIESSEGNTTKVATKREKTESDDIDIHIFPFPYKDNALLLVRAVDQELDASAPNRLNSTNFPRLVSCLK